MQPRTQEVFDDLGIVDAVHAAGGPYPRMAKWEGGVRVTEWDFMEAVPPSPHVPHGLPWMVPQWRTQEILHDRLRELGGSVEFGTALTALRQEPDGVVATLTGPDGATGTVRAAYLVAADGGRSTVRHALGIGMTGESVDPSPVLVADVRVEGVPRDNWHVWPEADGGLAMLCPLAGTDTFQLVVRYERDGEHPDTSPQGVREALAARTHFSADQVTDVLWASDFRPRAALADRFRAGRVLLAGDAAHVHSPAGGQGLNTGVQDAYNLGWKLGLVLRHGVPDALLDSYQDERLPVAAGVLRISTRLHTAVRTTVGPASMRRDAETRQLGVGYRGGPLSREHRTGLPDDALHAGDRAPDAHGHTTDGRPLRLFDAFRGPHFTLLAVGTEQPPPALDPALAHLCHADGDEIRTAYGTGFFLVRPDGYVSAAADTPAPVADAFAELLGRAPVRVSG